MTFIRNRKSLLIKSYQHPQETWGQIPKTFSQLCEDQEKNEFDEILSKFTISKLFVTFVAEISDKRFRN